MSTVENPPATEKLSVARLIRMSVAKSKVWIALAMVSGLLILGGFSFGQRSGLLLGFLLAVSLNCVVFFYEYLRLDSIFQGHELEGRDPWGLLPKVRELATRLGMRRPRLILNESATPFAYSAGLLPAQAGLFISRELLQRLDSDELEAVLVFELLKLKTQATATNTMASALAGLFSHGAGIVDSVLLLRFLRKKNEDRYAGPLTLLVAPLVIFLVRFSVGKKEILELDRQTTEFTGKPKAFARALYKLDSYQKTRPLNVDLSEAHLFTVNPVSPLLGGLRFIETHPPIETRIKALLGHFPI